MTRRAILILVAVALLGAGAFWAWRLPAVQDALLARTDLAGLSDHVASDPADWRAQYWYGRKAEEAGDLTTAETALRTSLGVNANFIPAAAELGKVLFATGRTEEAFQLLRMAVGRDPRNVDSRLALGALYRSQGAYGRAMDVLNEALKLQPKNARALYELAASQALSQQAGNAEATLRRGLRYAPNDPLLLEGLSRVLQQKGSSTEAEALARRACRIKPGDADALVLLAQILAHKQPAQPNREEALRLLEQARAVDAGRKDVPWAIAQIRTASGDWAGAVPELLRVIQANPDQPQAYFLLARAYRHQNKPAEAKQAEEAFHRKEAYARAIQSLESKLGAKPESAELRFKLAELHVAAGHSQQAIALYRSGLQRDPDNAAARKRLSELIRRSLNE